MRSASHHFRFIFLLRNIILLHSSSLQCHFIHSSSPQLLDALAYLQACGIAHRDLKLQNLLLDSTERELKLCDFGLAKVGEGMLAAEGVGTQAYWAPELWMEPECDRQKLDMWACGMMLHQLVAGVEPFVDTDFEAELTAEFLMGVSESFSAFGAAAGSAAGPVVPAGCPPLSAGLREVLGGLLRPDASKRFTAAGALASPWFSAEATAAEARARGAGYAAAAGSVKAVAEAGLAIGRRVI
jgi:serine/threonine protein kinase